MNPPPPLASREQYRARRFGKVWAEDLPDVFADVAPYYDRGNSVATLGLIGRFMDSFMSIVELNPGGRFYHSDMLRPANPVVKHLYYAYLRFTLWFTALLFRSGDAAQRCRRYFIEALHHFYSAGEMSAVLREHGFADVSARTVLFGMVGFHRAVKPSAG